MKERKDRGSKEAKKRGEERGKRAEPRACG